jgi:hypothetical protein
LLQIKGVNVIGFWFSRTRILRREGGWAEMEVEKKEEEDYDDDDNERWSLFSDMIRQIMHFCLRQTRRFHSDTFVLSVIPRVWASAASVAASGGGVQDPLPESLKDSVYGRTVGIKWHAHDMSIGFRENFSQVCCGSLRSHWFELRKYLSDFDLCVGPLSDLRELWWIEVALPLPGKSPAHFCPPVGYLDRPSVNQSAPNF